MEACTSDTQHLAVHEVYDRDFKPIAEEAIKEGYTESPYITIVERLEARYPCLTNTPTKGHTTMAFSAWDLIDAILSSGEARRTLLFGPPGTGKTFAAARRGLRKDQKVYSLTMTEETPAAEIRGHFLPRDGEFVWMDGPAIRAWREGARLVINEIDRASGDCMSLLNAILDDPDFAELTLPTGETVRPAEGFQIVGTMNGEPMDLEPSLRDRFPVTVEVNDVNPDALATLPDDLQEAARNTALIDDPERRVSVRAWLEFANLRTRLVKDRSKDDALDLAAQAVFGKNSKEALKALKIAAVKK